MHMKKTSLDLTQGSITKQIILFALPILLSQVFQNLYNSVDSLIVGNFLGTTALAAVTSCADISQLLVGFFTGLSAGAGVLFARYFGMKNYERLHDAISTSLIFSFIIGITMMAVGICIADVLLNIVACPADVYDEAIIYLRVYLVGLLFTSLYNVASGVLRSVGDSRNPFIYLVISSILNIILDIIFVVVFKMQVLGVALATIISQLLSVILVYYQLTHAHDVYRIDLRHLKFDSTMLKEVISLGLPAALQSCLISISNLFVQRYVNLFGSSVMAGVGAAKKIDKFVGLIANSLGMSTATFVSQNIGAKRIDRAKKGIRITFVLAFIPVAIIGSLIYIYANRAISLFIDDKDAIYYGAMMIQTMMPLYYSQSINQIMLNTLRGYGKSFVAMILSLIGMIGIRQLFLAISFSIERNVNHVFLGYPIGWIFSALFVSLYYFIVIRPKYK